ncbi:MAG TPA: amidohydrolase family protein [Methanocorpusculum sp.]|nr:amidohydrolase family protein [Methanocorpusculum sp.]
MDDIALISARLPNGRIADISILNGLITHIGCANSADVKVDCQNQLCIPAAIDVHVHMRDGSQSSKEDWTTGSQSAVAGGVATVIDQPNTVPPIETVSDFKSRVDMARKSSLCHYGINGSATKTSDISGLVNAGAFAFGEMFTAPSSYGYPLDINEISSVLTDINSYGSITTIHAELIKQMGVNNLSEHSLSRSVDGEADIITKINKTAPLNAKLHYCHMSGAQSIKCALSRNNTSCEVTPHHLFLSYDQLSNQSDTLFKINPPIRTKQDQLKIWEIYDQIPIIASDHAPHTCFDKSLPFIDAPSGVPGVETMMPLLMNAVFQGKISLQSIITKTVTNPYSVFGYIPPSISVGSRADLAVYSNEPVVIHADNLHSKCGWSPYEGLPGVFPMTTIVGGSIVWHNNEFITPLRPPIWFNGKHYIV